jgi:hypothetical protein
MAVKFGGADLVLVHNVFQYIDGREAQIQALKTIDGLCRPGGFISLAGDAFGFDSDPSVMAALDKVEAEDRRYGVIPSRARKG